MMKLGFFCVPLWSCVTLISVGLPDVEIGVEEWGEGCVAEHACMHSMGVRD